MIVYDTNGEQPLSAMISMITKVSFIQTLKKFFLNLSILPKELRLFVSPGFLWSRYMSR